MGIISQIWKRIFVTMAQGLFQKVFNKLVWNTEARYVNLENPKVPINGWTLDQALGGNISGTGRSISANGALTLSAVYRAVAIKAGFISSLPFQVFRKTDKGRELDTTHPASYLLSRRPNNKLSKTVYFDRAMNHFELQGNHFAFIQHNGIGKPTSLNLEKPENVTVIEGIDSLIYKLKGVEDLVPSYKMIHVQNMGDGCNGKSVLSYMREDASLMMDIRGYGESFFGRGGKPAGLVLPKRDVTPTQRQEMKHSFTEAKMQGGDVVMPWGWEYKEMSIPPKDADWVVSNDITVSMVARWFGVPTQKLGDSAVKYSNVEFMGIEFLQDTMAPIASKFENEYTNKLFPLSSEANLYAEFNLDAYLRADSVSKAEAMAKRVQNGLLTPNEGRALDNRDAKEGGDDLMMQGATVPIKMAGIKATPTPRKSLRKKIEEQVRNGTDAQLILEGILGNDGKGY